MRGISRVLAIILIVIIVVALVGLTYSFSIALFGVTTEAGTRTTERAVTSLLSQMRIESVSENKIYIRNIGTTDLSDFTILVNNKKIQNFGVDPPVIEPDQMGTISINDYIGARDNEITILSSEGATLTEKTEDMLFCNDTDVVLCLTFDEGSGTKIYDYGPYGNNGTVSNPMWTMGRIGSALDFPTNIFDIPNSASLNITKNITIASWFYPRSVGGGFIGLRGYNPTWGYSFRWSSDGGISLRYQNATGDWHVAPTTNPVLNESHLNSWHHVAVTYDLANVRFYIDGSLVESVPQTATPGPSVNRVTIGNAGWGNFDGLIDEVRILNRTLTEEEIEDIYKG